MFFFKSIHLLVTIFVILSSDDEIEKDFVGYKKPVKANKGISNQFEKEMDFNLSKIITSIGKSSEEQLKNVVDVQQEEESDTDSEVEEATGQRVTKKRQHFTNDDLFYDPKMDEADEEWINEQRMTFKNFKNEEVVKKSQMIKPPDSDAVLNCPCCMIMVCMDCQR